MMTCEVYVLAICVSFFLNLEKNLKTHFSVKSDSTKTERMCQYRFWGL